MDYILTHKHLEGNLLNYFRYEWGKHGTCYPGPVE